MTRIIVTHEVNDIEHWLTSKKRQEVFEGIASDIRTFVHPSLPNRVGLSMNVPDLEKMQAMLASPVGAAAMKHDGVKPETVTIYLER